MKFYLDGTLYDNPNGWESLTERIFYEEGISGYLTELSGSVSFYGGAYTYLLGLRNLALCESIPVVITDSCADGIEKNIFEGFIFLTDVEFNLIKCFATVEFVDNGFVSKIDNNKSIKCYLGVNRSKNDIDISAYDTPQTNIALRNSANGADITNAVGYRIFDAYKFIISFMTDGTVDFVSDFFDYSGTGTNATAFYSALMRGEEIRTSNAANSAYISFEELFNDTNAIFNLAFSVELINGRPAIRIEPKSYYRQSGEINYFVNPADLTQQISRDKLYAKVKFGCVNGTTTYTYLQNIAFIGTHQEEYHLLGECNSSAVLDLTLNTLITDTNIIQDVLPSGTANDNYDEDTFLIVLDSSNVNVSTLKPAGLTYYYNEAVNNLHTSEYWFGDIPNSIAIFLDLANYAFYANRLTTNQAFSGTVFPTVPAYLVFNNDTITPGFDTAGAYNTANGRYVAPVNQVYDFEVSLYLTQISGGLFISIIRYTSGGVEVSSKNIFCNSILFGEPINPPNAPTPAPSDTIVVNGSYSVYMDATDYCTVGVYGMGEMLPISYFKTSFAGGVAQTYDETQIPIVENSIEYNISCDKWAEIKSTPFKTFSIDYTDGQVKGWLNEMTRNISTGETNVIINSKPIA